jgi:hypothetical protein
VISINDAEIRSERRGIAPVVFFPEEISADVIASVFWNKFGVWIDGYRAVNSYAMVGKVNGEFFFSVKWFEENKLDIWVYGEENVRKLAGIFTSKNLSTTKEVRGKGYTFSCSFTDFRNLSRPAISWKGKRGRARDIY